MFKDYIRHAQHAISQLVSRRLAVNQSKQPPASILRERSRQQQQEHRSLPAQSRSEQLIVTLFTGKRFSALQQEIRRCHDMPAEHAGRCSHSPPTRHSATLVCAACRGAQTPHITSPHLTSSHVRADRGRHPPSGNQLNRFAPWGARPRSSLRPGEQRRPPWGAAVLCADIRR